VKSRCNTSCLWLIGCTYGTGCPGRH
jgi:hypothetical protein